MDKSIIIKSNKHGLSLYIDPNLSFNEACDKLATKLSETKKFFGNASMALTLEGKSFNSEEINKLIDIIDKESDLDILAVIDSSEVNDKLYIEELKKLNYRLDDNACEIYSKAVKEDETLDFKGSVLVLSDLPKSSEIHANGSIYVLGNAYGKIYAGELGNKKSNIYVGNLKTDNINIADCIYVKPKEEIVVKKSLFGKNKTMISPDYPYLFSIVDDEVVAKVVKDIDKLQNDAED